MAGYAGVCFAFATERISIATFDPSVSILVVSMVVIGGLDSIAGAVLGALYLVGLPAIFGTTPTIEFLTSGLGLMAFILYLPGGLAEVMHRLGRPGHGRCRAPPARRPGGTARRAGRRRGAATARAVGADRGGGRGRSREPADRRGHHRRRRRRREALGLAARREGPARLEVDELVVSFGGLRALDGVSLSAEPGTIVGLIGPNGSGKTTLLDAVSGLVAPDAGRVALDGEDLADYLPEERSRARPGPLVPGLPAVPRAHGARTRSAVAEDARRRVGVLSTTLQLPVGAARRAGQARGRRPGHRARSASSGSATTAPVHLSTGTRRVVDLASIVLAGPRLLLLDEPTAGHRPARGRGLHPAAPPAPRGDRLHDPPRRARRARWCSSCARPWW